MKRRVFAAALAALLLTGCGSRGESGSASSQEAPEEPVVIGTLALELPAGGDADAARAFADSLPEARAALGGEIGRVELSVSPSPAATAQALAEGGVDLAFLPAEDFLRAGGGLAILADGTPDTSGTLVPGERAEIVTAGTDYGRRLAARTDPSWEELAHARWGVLGQESRAGYRCLDLWLCDNYEDNGIRDLPEVTVYDDWDALLQAAEAGDIDALPLKPGLRTEELSLLAETEGIVAQVAAVREDAALQSRAFALALEAAVSRLPEGQREALLGAKDFVSLPDGGLNAARRSLAAFGGDRRTQKMTALGRSFFWLSAGCRG